MHLPEEIISVLDFEVSKSCRLQGGDINHVFALETSKGPAVIKYNALNPFPDMLFKEKLGLEWLAASQQVTTPKVWSQGQTMSYQYLVLELIPTSSQPVHPTALGTALAHLHQTSNSHFGASTDNYIGRLKQSNRQHLGASDFYITERLEPQFALAADNGYPFQTSALYRRLSELMPPQAPALIHGDLWSGNLLVDEEQQPVFIDPATHYGIAEMDLALMRLFGGFSQEVFDVYDLIKPPLEGWQERVGLYQLYYLLVHLNLFGGSYEQQVRHSVKKYH